MRKTMGLLDDLDSLSLTPQTSGPLSGLEGLVLSDDPDAIRKARRKPSVSVSGEVREPFDPSQGIGGNLDAPGGLLTGLAAMPSHSQLPTFVQQAEQRGIRPIVAQDYVPEFTRALAGSEIAEKEEADRKAKRSQEALSALRLGIFDQGEDIVLRGGGDYEDVEGSLAEESATQKIIADNLWDQGAYADAVLHRVAGSSAVGAFAAKVVSAATIENPVVRGGGEMLRQAWDYGTGLLSGTPAGAQKNLVLGIVERQQMRRDERSDVGYAGNITTGSAVADVSAGLVGQLAGSLPLMKSGATVLGGLGVAPELALPISMTATNLPQRVVNVEEGGNIAQEAVGLASEFGGGALIPKITAGATKLAMEAATAPLARQVTAGTANIIGQGLIGDMQIQLETLGEAAVEDRLTAAASNILLSAGDTREGVRSSIDHQKPDGAPEPEKFRTNIARETEVRAEDLLQLVAPPVESVSEKRRISIQPKNKSVKIGNLHPNTVAGIYRISEILAENGLSDGDVVITSGRDSHSKVKSKHNEGLAIDIALRGEAVGKEAEIEKVLRENGIRASFERKGQKNPNNTVSTGDHIHLDFRDAPQSSASPQTTVNDLISAIGKSEGWGLDFVDGSPQMARYNERASAPFGLLGDSKSNPNLRNDPQALYDFMMYKLADPKSATYIEGLVRSDGTIDTSKISLLRDKWAPLGAENDPNNLNANWLRNVEKYLGVTGEAAAAGEGRIAITPEKRLVEPTETPLTVRVGDKVDGKKIVGADSEDNTVLFEDGTMANADAVNTLAKAETAKAPKPQLSSTNVGNERLVVDPRSLAIRTEDFQNRDEAFSSATVAKILESRWDWNKYDPIKVWQDPSSGKLVVVSGHSRREAAVREGIEALPVDKIDVGSFEEAQKLALDSNTLSTKETPLERSKVYRGLHGTESKSEIDRRAKNAEGKEAQTILALSRLDEESKALQDLAILSKAADNENYRQVERIAKWTGQIQNYFPEFNRQHQNEVYDYLRSSEGAKVRSFDDLRQVVQRQYDRASSYGEFTGESRLNFKNARDIHPDEVAFDKRLAEAKVVMTEAENKYFGTKGKDGIRIGGIIDEALSNGVADPENHPAVKRAHDEYEGAKNAFLDLYNRRADVMARIRREENGLFVGIDEREISAVTEKPVPKESKPVLEEVSKQADNAPAFFDSAGETVGKFGESGDFAADSFAAELRSDEGQSQLTEKDYEQLDQLISGAETENAEGAKEHRAGTPYSDSAPSDGSGRESEVRRGAGTPVETGSRGTRSGSEAEGDRGVQPTPARVSGDVDRELSPRTEGTRVREVKPEPETPSSPEPTETFSSRIQKELSPAAPASEKAVLPDGDIILNKLQIRQAIKSVAPAYSKKYFPKILEPRRSALEHKILQEIEDTGLSWMRWSLEDINSFSKSTYTEEQFKWLQNATNDERDASLRSIREAYGAAIEHLAGDPRYEVRRGDPGDGVDNYYFRKKPVVENEAVKLAKQAESQRPAERVVSEKKKREIETKQMSRWKVGERPPLVTASERIVPPHSGTITPEHYGGGITEHQVKGINLMVDAYRKGEGAFLLGDGVGVGKTRELLVTANEIHKSSNGGKILIVAPSTVVRGGNYQKDAKALGIDLKKFEVISYDDLRTGKTSSKDYEAALFDEAQQIKNISSQRSDAAESLTAKYRVYATATPFDKREHATVFLARLKGIPVDVMAKELGYEFVQRTNMLGDPLFNKNGDPIYEARLSKNGAKGWNEVDRNILDTRDKAIKEGKMLRRELPFFGDVFIDEVVLPGDLAARNQKIEEEWADSRLSLQRTIPQNAALDSFKAKSAFDRMKEMRQRGIKKIVLVSNFVGDELHVMNDRLSASRETVPSAFSQLRKMMDAEGIKYAEVTGQVAAGERATQIRNFQTGDAEVVLITYGTGGVGVDLDDVVGTAPRGVVVVSADFSAISLDQMLGRVSRLNTQSPTEVRILVAAGTKGDLHKRGILEQKQKTLSAIQRGEDPDFSDAAMQAFSNDPAMMAAGKDGLVRLQGFGYEFIPFSDIVAAGAKGGKTAKDFAFVRVIPGRGDTAEMRERLAKVVGEDGKYINPIFFDDGEFHHGFKVKNKDYDAVIRALADELGIPPEKMPMRDALRDKLNSNAAVKDQSLLASSVFGATVGQKKAVRKGSAPQTTVPNDTVPREAAPRTTTNPFEPLWQSQSAEVQSQVEANRRRAEIPLIEKVSNAWTKFVNNFTREFPHLPNTAENAEIRARMLEIKKGGGIAAEEVKYNFRGLFSDLQPNEQLLMSDVAIRRDMMEQVERQRAEGADDEDIMLPFGYESVEQLDTDLQSAERALGANPRVADALDAYYGYVREVAGKNMDLRRAGGFFVPDLTREHYFHRVVQKYAGERSTRSATGKPGAKLTRKGWQLKRVGSDENYVTSLIETAPEVLIGLHYENQQLEFLNWMSQKYKAARTEGKQEAVRRLGGDESHPAVEPMTALVLDEMGYTEWSPTDSNPYFNALSIPRSAIVEAAVQGLETLSNVPIEALKQVVAVGKDVKILVPKDVAATLGDMTPDITPAGRLFQKVVMKPWKRVRLLDPLTIVKYFERQVLSDVEKTFHNPKAFLKVPDAVSDLYDVFIGKKAPSDDLDSFMRMGGMYSTLDFADDVRVKDGILYLTNEFAKSPKDFAAVARAIKAATVDVPNQAREVVDILMRYANFKSYLEQVRSNPEGTPDNFGASHPDHVMAFEGEGADIRKAYKLSNDLIGAYDRITRIGVGLARNVRPFHRWTEANFKSWLGLMANTFRDYRSAGTLAELGGKLDRSILRQVPLLPFKAYRIGKFVVASEMMNLIAEAWNSTQEEDEKLPERIKDHIHITLGNNDDGSVDYFDRFSGLDDVTNILGLTDIHRELLDVVVGKKTFEQVVKELSEDSERTFDRMQQVAAEGWLSGFGPYQTGFELLFGKTAFPDPLNPRPIVDRWQHFFRGFGGRTAEHVYNQFKNIPQQPWYRKGGPLYHIEAGEIALEDMRQKVNDWKEKTTGKKTSSDYSYDDAMRAAYYYRRSLRGIEQGYSDLDELKHWAMEYVAVADKKQFQRVTNPDVLAKLVQRDLTKKVRKMTPLNGLSKKEQTEFMNSLSEQDKMQLRQAEEYIKRLADMSDDQLDLTKAAQQKIISRKTAQNPH